MPANNTPLPTASEAGVTPPNVGYRHSHYDTLMPTWEMIRDCINGERAIKAKRTKYLPDPDPNPKDPKKAAARYNNYLDRAIFFNATGRTLRGLVGQVFSRDSTHELPATVEDLLPNIDGKGTSMEQLAKMALEATLAFGRGGVLADYPPRTDEEGNVLPTTVQDLQEAGVRPRIAFYEPENVINWREGTFGALTLLTLVVLAEEDVVNDDGFERICQYQYRVLRLSPQREYTAEVWRQIPNSTRYEKVAEYSPRDASGQPFREIPFTFIGPEDNTCHVDLPPMQDIATINLGHYRNSADYEESLHVVGQPTLVLSGLTRDWVTDVLKGEVRFGSLGAIPLPENASGDLVQAAPNTMAKEGMEHKEKLMKALGAKLVDEQRVQRTATEANMDETASVSVLGSTAKNVSEALTRALKWMAMFLGVDNDSIEYTLNTDFEVAKMEPSERAQLLKEYTEGGITWEEYRWNLKRGGVAFEDDAVAKKAIDAEKESMMDALGLGSGAGLKAPGQQGNNNAQ